MLNWQDCPGRKPNSFLLTHVHHQEEVDVNGASSQECNLVSGKRKNICLIFCHDLIKQCLKPGFFRVPLLKIKGRKSQRSGTDIQNKLTHSSQDGLWTYLASQSSTYLTAKENPKLGGNIYFSRQEYKNQLVENKMPGCTDMISNLTMSKHEIENKYSSENKKNHMAIWQHLSYNQIYRQWFFVCTCYSLPRKHHMMGWRLNFT